MTRAREIMKAFGPCSIVWETMTEAEVTAEVAEVGELEFARTAILVEDVSADRRCLDDSGPYEEWKLREAELVARLRAIGIEVAR